MCRITLSKIKVELLNLLDRNRAIAPVNELVSEFLRVFRAYMEKDPHVIRDPLVLDAGVEIGEHLGKSAVQPVIHSNG